MTARILAPVFGAILLLSGGGAEAQSCTGGWFDGPYIGANIGFGRSDAGQSSVGEPHISGSDNALIAGGQVGYNRQCGHIVLGVEADLNYAGFATSTAWPDPIFLNDKVDWFGTVRGRVGFLLRNTAMAYATGGWAYANVSHTLSDPNFGFSQSDDDFKSGWTLGGGVELVHFDRWLLRAEALYVDLGSNSRTYTYTGCAGTCTGTAKWDDSFWVARLGISYKFGVREPVPLK